MLSLFNTFNIILNFAAKYKNKIILAVLAFNIVGLLYFYPEIFLYQASSFNIPVVKILQNSGVDMNSLVNKNFTPKVGKKCNHSFLTKNPLAVALFKNDAQTFISLYEQGLDIDAIMPCNRQASARGILISKIIAGDIKLQDLEKSAKLHQEISDTYAKIIDQSSINAIYAPNLKYPKEPLENQIITDGYNTGIEQYGDGYLVAYRSDVIETSSRYNHRHTHNTNKILRDYYQNNYRTNVISYFPTLQLQQLDQNFQKYGKIYDLTAEFERHNIIHSAEDPRLFRYHNQLYMLFNMDNIGGNRSMYLAEITNQNSGPTITRYLRLPSPFGSKVEKNWSPIIHNNKLYFVYSYEPNLVLIEPNIKTGSSKVITKMPNKINSGYGQVRGGTQFVPIGDNSYLSIAHTSIEIKNTLSGKKRAVKLVYFAYPVIIKFNDKGEARFVDDINRNPIFAHTIPYNQTIEKDVFFPSGLVVSGENLVITSGVSDQHSSLIVVNKEKFLKQIGYIKS